MGNKRVNVKAILADPDLRRKLMVPTIQATQAREGIDTTMEQADRAYYVVSEGEHATFFDLERFKGGKRGEPDLRHEMFVRALCEKTESVRFDVAKRDFLTVDGTPLTYRNIGIIAPLIKENVSISHVAEIQHGLSTNDDDRFVRMRWEMPKTFVGCELQDFTVRKWGHFAKGGEFARFYFDSYLLVEAWQDFERIKKSLDEKYPYLNGNYGWVLHPENKYLQPGLTYSRRSQRGFSVRYLPPGRFFSDKGPTVFPLDSCDLWPLLAFLNSNLAAFVLSSITSFGSFEVGAVRKLPIADRIRNSMLGSMAKQIHDIKAYWDTGNEVSSRFQGPMLNREEIAKVDLSVSSRLDSLLNYERAVEEQIQELFVNLNIEIYRLYAIPDTIRKTIEETLGECPPEILWPQMEGKTTDQKRMEHVWRLLSYAVKRVLEADDDGIIPFGAVNGESRLVDRVREELAGFFPGRDANQIEVEIVNELKQTVRGYRKCASLGEWLDNAYFEYHCGLYKRRPIFWHIASAQGTAPFAFGVLVHFHRFDKNRIAKLRSTHLRDAIEEFRREAGLADKAGRTDDRLEWQAKVEEAQALDKKLQLIQEGHHEGAEGGDRDYRILTPWKKQEERPKGWDPDLDDGVKVNIEPFEKAGVLRAGKVT